MIKKYIIIVFCVLLNSGLHAQLQKLKVGPNNRFLVKEDGSTFVWIGETNWFFAKLPPETIDEILRKRSEQGFTVMFVSCREKLYNGESIGSIQKPNEKWWSYLDEYIEKCEQESLYVGLTLGWWGKINSSTKSEMYNYGKWVGNRYRNHNNIIWLTLGEAGSHLRKAKLSEEKLHALVKGIRDGDTGNKLLTIHADFKRGTSMTADGNLCDFNNWQTSQWESPTDLPKKDERNWTVWEAIEYDYNKHYDGFPKPTMDAEAIYENNKDFCGATPIEIRRRAWFTILAGAFGHTYGAGGIWDGLNSKVKCSKNALDALEYKGAKQIGFLSQFLHKMGDDILKLRPGQNIILEGNSNDYDEHIQAAVASDKSFALVYSASDSEYCVDLSQLANQSKTFVWFNPRTNTYTDPEKLGNNLKKYYFDPPGESGQGNDWVLVLKSR